MVKVGLITWGQRENYKVRPTIDASVYIFSPEGGVVWNVSCWRFDRRKLHRCLPKDKHEVLVGANNILIFHALLLSSHH